MMQSAGNTDTPQGQRWLALARAGWLVVLAIGIGLFILSIPLQVAALQVPCDGLGCQYGQLTSAQMQALPRSGLTLANYVAVNIALNTLFPLVFCLVAALIVWRISNDWFGIYVALSLVLFGFSFSSPLILTSATYPALLLPILLWRMGGANIGVFLLLFPDGRFVPRWTRWLVPVWLLREVAFVLAPDSPPAQILPLLLLTAVFAQVYRYRRVSTTLQRQQTKWFLFGITGTLIGFAASMGLATSLDPLAVGWNLVGAAGLFASVLLIPVSIGIAILRSHLWDIDILMRRTLIYGLVTAALGLVYFASVVVLGELARAITGQQQSDIVIVLSTLAIAGLFTPMRRRIQQAIDRRLYRSKYDAATVLAAFGATARDEVDLGKLKEELLTVVAETMQPASASLWLKRAAAVERKQPEPSEHF